MDEDFIDDDENLDEGYYQQDESDNENSDEFLDDDDSSSSTPIDTKAEAAKYGNKMTELELKLSLAYDDLVKIGRSNEKDMLDDALTVVISANPKHTNAKTVNEVFKELSNRQNHNRYVNTLYTPENSISGEDVEDYNGGDGEFGFNKMFSDEARALISQFIGYLANRDLSKDDEFQKRRKRRHIPAFIIFLFTAGLYDFLLSCETLPQEYKDQVDLAFKKIMKAKYDIVEELARKYEEMGRDKVAERVRKVQLAWFDKGPAEIRTYQEYADLELTYEDVVIYREYRSKFTNTSKAITQDVISNYIYVIVDPDAGIIEKLKDKTRGDAITDVKQVWKDWIKENANDSELGKKIIWNDVNEYKQIN